jgi:hypothetical protein
MQAQIVVTHVTSYNVLVGGVVFYPLKVTMKSRKKLHVIDQGGRHKLIVKLYYR